MSLIIYFILNKILLIIIISQIRNVQTLSKKFNPLSDITECGSY